jgi:hypothetical protein
MSLGEQLDGKIEVENMRKEEVMIRHDFAFHMLGVISLWCDHLQIIRLMQLKSESDQKEKELLEESRAVNLRMQSKNEEFIKLSVTSEQIKGEFQILKADRDKLMQEIATLSQSQAALEKNAEVQSKEAEKRQVRSNSYLCSANFFFRIW